MRVLVNLVELASHVEINTLHPDTHQIAVSSSMGTAVLDLISTSSCRSLIMCKAKKSNWQAMLVLSPLIGIGVEVFSDNWER